MHFASVILLSFLFGLNLGMLALNLSWKKKAVIKFNIFSSCVTLVLLVLSLTIYFIGGAL